MANDPEVRIRLEVSVPCNVRTQIETPFVPATSPPCAPAPEVSTRAPSILARRFPQTIANVKTDGSGTSGVICVVYDHDLDGNNRPPDKVVAWVYPKNQKVPNDPPPYAPSETSFPASGYWQLPEVPLAECSAYDYPWNQLAIWRYPHGVPTPGPPEIIWFQGRCAAQTDCEGELIGHLGHPRPCDTIVDIGPYGWMVQASGFQGSTLAPMNGQWRVLLRVHNDREMVWETGQPFEIRVRVPLSGDEPCTLTMCWGAAKLRYAVPRWEWNPLGTNRLSAVWSGGVPEDSSMSPSIVLVPIKEPLR